MKPIERVNGRTVEAPPRQGYPPRDRIVVAGGPQCPKHCDVATPPEHGGGDQWVCVGCGTQFTWKARPS